MIKTKIVCTIGPATNSYEKIIELIQSGMNIARINFSHGTHDEHLQTIQILKRARADLRKPLAIMLDTKGPEVRIGQIPNDEIKVKAKDQIRLVNDENVLSDSRMMICPPFVLEYLNVGNTILFNDGYVSSHVIDKNGEGILIEIDNAGILSSGKGVNIPGVPLNLPALTDRDIKDLIFGCEQDIDIVAASFIRNDANIHSIKQLLKEHGKGETLVIAKIECHEGIDNFDVILQVADGIMIARGDLGVEVPLSQVPKLQKMMIRKCYLAGKPAITATQMLESMNTNPRPTRAEVSDVANAVYDSTSALMLSAETAMGKYPIESVQVMHRISGVTEEDINYKDFFTLHGSKIYHDVPSAVAFSSVNTAYNAQARSIFVFTSTGYTPRLVSRLRPDIPVIALTDNIKVYHQLSLNWGVIPLFSEHFETISEAFKRVSDFALQRGYVHLGDIVVLTAGAPFGVSGTTNMMIVENIGDVLLRGHQGYGGHVTGRVIVIDDREGPKVHMVKDKILVIRNCNDSYLGFLKEAKAIILENYSDDLESEKYAVLVAQTLNKSIIVRADGASSILKNGQWVTMDSESAIVYNGVMELKW